MIHKRWRTNSNDYRSWRFVCVGLSLYVPEIELFLEQSDRCSRDTFDFFRSFGWEVDLILNSEPHCTPSFVAVQMYLHVSILWRSVDASHRHPKTPLNPMEVGDCRCRNVPKVYRHPVLILLSCVHWPRVHSYSDHRILGCSGRGWQNEVIFSVHIVLQA